VGLGASAARGLHGSECDLSAGTERSMDEVRAIFRHFCEALELRAEDGWEHV